MSKPEMTVEVTTKTDIHGNLQTVCVIDGAHEAPCMQTYLRCTGCGRGNQYRFNQDSNWITFKCPTCSAVSKHYYEDDEDEEE